MSVGVFTSGENAIPPSDGSWDTIQPKNLTGDFIAYYHVPPVAFRLISPETLNTVIQSWITLHNSVDDRSEGGSVLTIKGVYIDADNGEIYIKGNAQPVSCPQITLPDGSTIQACTQQAGVNPIAVLTVIGGLFAAAAITITLIAVYAPKVATQAIQQGIKPVSQGIGAGARAGAILVGLGIAIALGIVAYREKLI